MIAQALLASTAIVLLSFISEDAATISSALSLFGGPINWQLGFAACFAGIWLGDLGLYSLARCFGKPILKSRWIARFADADLVVFRPEQDCRHCSYSCRSRRCGGCAQETRPHSRLGEALDAVGVLAGVAVLHSGGRLLCVAGSSPSQLDCTDFGKSWNRYRWIRWRIETR